MSDWRVVDYRFPTLTVVNRALFNDRYMENTFEILDAIDNGAPLTLDMVAEVVGPAIYELVDAEIEAALEADGGQ